MSLSALHLAVLVDGRRLTLLNDRGWSVSGPPDVWDQASVADIEEVARIVAGSDEPDESCSVAEMDGCTGRTSMVIRLPHDGELSERLRTRIKGG